MLKNIAYKINIAPKKHVYNVKMAGKVVVTDLDLGFQLFPLDLGPGHWTLCAVLHLPAACLPGVTDDSQIPEY